MNLLTLSDRGGIGLFAAKGRLAVEFSNDYLKLALVHQVKDKLECVFCEHIAIKDMPPEKVADILNSTIKTHKEMNFDPVLVLPVSAAITKTIQIPSTDETEIKDILNLQAGRQTPYSREELVIDHLNLGQFQGVYTKVLVVMVTIQYINEKIAILALAGLKISKVMFASEGTAAFFALKMKPEAFSSVRAVLDMDIDSSDICIYNEKGLLSVRNINIGAYQLAQEGEPTRNKLCEEIIKTIEGYQSEDISISPTVLYLVKNGAVEQDLKAAIAKGTTLEVKDFDISNYINVRKPYDNVFKDERSPSYFKLLTDLVALDDVKIDLIPEEVKLQRKFEQKAKKIVTAGALFMVIFFQICLIFVSKMYYKDKYLNELKNKFKERTDEAAMLQVMSDKTRGIRNFVSDRMDISNIMAKLYDMMPDEIYLKGITIDKDRKIFIKGTSKSMSRIFSFVTELENDPLFVGVKSEYTESKKEGNEDVSDFGIVMNVEGRAVKPEEKAPDAGTQTK